MDKYERETRDLVNVESFSQLPFIRPTVKEKPSGVAIRLFGKDFAAATTTTTDDHQVNENNINFPEGEPAHKDHSSSSSRKFECHYCCRNFPTSQALGGHQNAHKRERQHAKRAHLQSASVHGGPDSHDYGLMTYNRFGPAPTGPLPFGSHSWSTTAATRLYGNASAYSNIAHQPLFVNGSPLTMWRIPAARGSVIPTHPQINDPKPLAEISSVLSSQSRLGYESKASMQDHVSLDLHL